MTFFISSLQSVSSELAQINPIQLEEIVVTNKAIDIEGASVVNYGLILYLIGLVAVAVFILFKYFKTFKVLKKFNFKKADSFNGMIAISDQEESFTFFNHVHINEDRFQDENVLKHEIQHVRLKHSYDILLYNVYKVLFWFNPFVFLLERRLKLIHEFQADYYSARDSGETVYINSLLNQVFGTSSIQFINQFNNQKSLKMRLKMLKQSRKKSEILKALMIVPMLGLLVLLGSWKANAEYSPLISQGDDKVYDQVDKMPEFKGGMEGLIKYISSNVKYPKSAEKNNVQGKVFVEFVVGKDGKVSNVKVKKAANKELDVEAVRVVQSMPDWTPGEKDGKKVKVKMVLPIVFKL